ncbi:MAG: hypothetical protein ABIJ00_02270 [Candidatus Eisenbacteria bacterium]
MHDPGGLPAVWLGGAPGLGGVRGGCWGPVPPGPSTWGDITMMYGE